MNGDGRDDMVIGDCRMFYLMLGRTIPGGGAPPDKADAVYTGAGGVGESLDGAGDLDGDGLDDSLVGAWARPDGGGAYLVLGGS